MRKLIVVLTGLGIMFCAVTAHALEVGEQEVNITVSETYVSRYVWRGQDLFPDNDGAHQPSIDITAPDLIFGKDVSLNIWGSFATGSGHVDTEELDYTLSFTKDYLDGAVTISEGYTFFHFPNTSRTADVQEPWLSVSLNEIPKLPIAVSMNVFAGYDFKVDPDGPNEGWYYSWGFGTDIPLPEWEIFQEDQALSVGITNWGNDGVADLKSSALYATDYVLSTSYAFGDMSISPSFNYTANYEDAINAGDDEIWGGVEVSYVF
ncbi:hypothetical protein ACFL1E_00220 [Candidatus Omnitrophota bacterium]